VTRPAGGRDEAEIDALVTDRYLESLLIAHGAGADYAPAPMELDRSVRVVADRLARALPRLHPSFRFEEALSARLTAAAIARRLPQAAGAEGTLVTLPVALPGDDPDLAAYLDGTPLDGDADLVRPWLIGGALTSAARAIRAVARTRIA
jgi:hypothetical protein